VDALVTELDDRLDHLLLLGLEDALLAAALDEDPELLGAHDPLRLLPGPEDPGDTPGDRREHDHERAQQAQHQLDEATQPQRERLGVGQGKALRHQLAEDDREQRQEHRHHDQ
jgi:hypothetical protein